MYTRIYLFIIKQDSLRTNKLILIRQQQRKLKEKNKEILCSSQVENKKNVSVYKYSLLFYCWKNKIDEIFFLIVNIQFATMLYV